MGRSSLLTASRAGAFSVRALGATALLLAATWATPARAACTNDTDCTTGATCGGEVCQWPAHACVPAGTDPQGSDGWCTTDDDCKCKSEGATCQAASSHCTFTIAGDAGAASSTDAATASSDASGTSSSSSGGSTGASSSSSSGASGYSSGGATGSSSGTVTGTGSSSGEVLPDADVASGSTSPSNSGGCTVAPIKTGSSSGTLFAVACAAALAFVGRRRR